MPTTYKYDSVASSMDTLFQIIEKKPVKSWDNVYTKMQTAGRGQMRKKWLSCAGNILSSIILPSEYPFTTVAASVATGALFVKALRGLNFNVLLKWPNDIILIDNGEYKVGGILLEERNNNIIAGIGINVNVLPDEGLMDMAPVLKPGFLQQAAKDKLDPEKIWRELVEWIYKFYSPLFAEMWNKLADEYLLWKGRPIYWSDGSERINGTLEGLAGDGSLILKTGDDSRALTSGEISPYNPEN